MNINEAKVQKIRGRYVENGETQFDKLKKLDKKVKRPARIFAYTLGTAGSLTLGTGMSLVMGVIGSSTALGIIIGCIGIALIAGTYPLFDKILSRRRKKYAAAIIELSNGIVNN